MAWFGRPVTTWGRTAVRRGILRTSVRQAASYVFVETGTAKMFWRRRNQFRLTSGQELMVDKNGHHLSQAPDQARWQIRVGKFQLASAMAAQPPTEVPGRTTPTPDGPVPSRTTTAPPTASGSEIGREDSLSNNEESTERAARTGDSPVERSPTAARRTLTSTSSQSLGGRSIGGFTLASSGGLFSDAGQNSLQGKLTKDAVGLKAGDPFPGNIHLVTAENRYGFDNVRLLPTEQNRVFGIGNEHAYWSIGTGSLPTSQVFAGFGTVSALEPTTVPIPHFDAYLIRLDEFGPIDAGLDPTAAAEDITGYAGLLGADPFQPSVVGATPLQDERAEFNKRATFALGEFRLTRTGPSGESVELAIRRSDQDRRIVKDFNDEANDQVTVNADVTAFNDVSDSRISFTDLVKVPAVNAYDSSRSRFSDLRFLRKAAATTLMADQLHDFAQRTGQTRFVVQEQNGTRKIIDITGYRK